MKQRIFKLVLSLYTECEAPVFVKVKPFTRIRRGKIEKVRSHYRRVMGRRDKR